MCSLLHTVPRLTFRRISVSEPERQHKDKKTVPWLRPPHQPGLTRLFFSVLFCSVFSLWSSSSSSSFVHSFVYLRFGACRLTLKCCCCCLGRMSYTSWADSWWLPCDQQKQQHQTCVQCCLNLFTIYLLLKSSSDWQFQQFFGSLFFLLVDHWHWQHLFNVSSPLLCGMNFCVAKLQFFNLPELAISNTAKLNWKLVLVVKKKKQIVLKDERLRAPTHFLQPKKTVKSTVLLTVRLFVCSPIVLPFSKFTLSLLLSD